MAISSTPATLPYMRDQVRQLLNEFDAADGLASYYALHHNPRRTTLTMNHNSHGTLDGFVVVCQTGIDLFRPVVTLRARGDGALPELLTEALLPGRPYLLIVPEVMVGRLEPFLSLSTLSTNHIYRLDPVRFHHEVNVLTMNIADPEGNPRAEIRRGGRPVAVAGINWRSPIFAEVFVSVEEAHRMMGMGRAVLNALTAQLLTLKVTPLYAVAEGNQASLQLAASLGYVDTGAREAMAQAALRTDEVSLRDPV